MLTKQCMASAAGRSHCTAMQAFSLSEFQRGRRNTEAIAPSASHLRPALSSFGDPVRDWSADLSNGRHAVELEGD